jgi:hypothetical protein
MKDVQTKVIKALGIEALLIWHQRAYQLQIQFQNFGKPKKQRHFLSLLRLSYFTLASLKNVSLYYWKKKKRKYVRYSKVRLPLQLSERNDTDTANKLLFPLAALSLRG